MTPLNENQDCYMTAFNQQEKREVTMLTAVIGSNDYISKQSEKRIIVEKNRGLKWSYLDQINCVQIPRGYTQGRLIKIKMKRSASNTLKQQFWGTIILLQQCY